MDLEEEAEELVRKLPPRPLYGHDSAALQADKEYSIYWVRGGYDGYGEEAPTQFCIVVDGSGLIALKYYSSDNEWRLISTGRWPEDAERVDEELNKVASSHSDWHRPLVDRV